MIYLLNDLKLPFYEQALESTLDTLEELEKLDKIKKFKEDHSILEMLNSLESLRPQQKYLLEKIVKYVGELEEEEPDYDNIMELFDRC